MKILITGGAGFIGANLCRRMLGDAAIDEVVVIDDLSTGAMSNLDGLDVRLVQASVLDDEALHQAAEGADAIVHLAALGSVPRSVLDPLAAHAANATGTLKVLEAARPGSAHVVLASSSSVYGANVTQPKVETQDCRPMSPYAVSKLATEQYAMAYARCYDLPVLPFRFFNVYGPLQTAGHDYAAVIPAFIDAALRGREVPINGDGLQTRDFTYVGTVVDLLTTAVVKRVVGEPTNLAFGTRITLLELVERLGSLMGQELAITWHPARAGDVRDSSADNGRLVSLFGDVESVPLDAGLRATIDWMRTTY